MTAGVPLLRDHNMGGSHSGGTTTREGPAPAGPLSNRSKCGHGFIYRHLSESYLPASLADL